MNYTEVRPTYKLVIVGDSKTGKSSLIRRHLTGRFNENSHYWPTLLQTEQDIVFQTKRGPIRFNVWDTTGGHKHPVLRRMYHRGSDCAIIMCDVTNETTCDNVFLWNTQLWDHCGRIPTVICGNKADSRNRTVFKFNPTVRKPNMQYFDISVKNNYCCSEPFIHLYYQLIGERFHFITLMPPNGLTVIQDENEFHDENEEENEMEGPEQDKDDLEKKKEIIKKIRDYLKEKSWALKIEKDNCEEGRHETRMRDNDNLVEEMETPKNEASEKARSDRQYYEIVEQIVNNQ